MCGILLRVLPTMLRSPRIGIPGVGIALLLTGTITAAAAPDSPRGAAKTALAYPHKSFKRQEFGFGARSYWLFEPDEPRPESAPVVVFNHGWFAVNPGVYGAWIEHLVRSGRVVIFPRYQNDVATNPDDFLPNALAAVLDAFDVLEMSRQHVRPDRDRFALIGHSAGGNLAAQVAAAAADYGLPKPRAVIAMMPGEVKPLPDLTLDRIPGDMLLVVAVAEDDRVVGDLRARQIFTEASSIPPERKTFVLYRTDLHGTPRLIADHLAPTAYHRAFDSGDGILRGFQTHQGVLNAFDHNGFWRVADVTLEAAFAGRTLDEATSKGALFRHLGYWSDGRPVERPVVSDDLSVIPRIHPTNGLKLINWAPRVAATPEPAAARR